MHPARIRMNTARVFARDRMVYAGGWIGVFLLALIALIPESIHGQTTSSLWGLDGELWNPAGRLGDYSFAGYRTGNVPLPDRSGNRIDVTSLGAIPNDNLDDTAAFKNAIAQATSGQAVYAPTGTYDLNDVLEIRKSGISLQGDGKGSTILFFHKSLTELRGPGGAIDILYPIDGTFPCAQVDPPPMHAGLGWSFAGGLVWIQGDDPIDATTKLTTVTQEARRGDKSLTLASTAGISPGMWIRLTETDPRRGGPNTGTLARYLHGDLRNGGCEQSGRMLVSFHSRVSAVDGNTVRLERFLPVDVRSIWRPEIHRFNPSVQEVGVEYLTLKFPEIRYAGHFNEPGYNGIHFVRVANCWVRDVEILNADSGVFASWMYFTTLDGITIDTQPGRIGGGHHAYDFYFLTNDNLLTNFNIVKAYVHDLTTEQYASGNVFSNGTGRDINLDHHMAMPHQNLYTNLNLGQGSRPFVSGGSGDRGSLTARYSTLWNVRADNDITFPTCGFGPQMTFVGVRSPTTTACTSAGWWVEKIDPAQVIPKNIHEAQLEVRSGGTPIQVSDLSVHQRDDGSIQISWLTPPSHEAAGFDIQRALAIEAAYARVNDQRIQQTGLVSFVDSSAAVKSGGTFLYRLVAHSTNEQPTYYGPIEIVATDRMLPSRFALYQNDPNPIVSSTIIRYDIASEEDVSLRVFDVTGRLIHVLMEGKQSPGRHVVAWNGCDKTGRRVSAGIYFYQMRTRTFASSRKLFVLR